MENNKISDLEKKVQSGDVESMAELAMYYFQVSVDENKSQSKKSFSNGVFYSELASENGHLNSRLNLAITQLQDYFMFAASNLLVYGGTSDIVFKMRKSYEKINKGLNLLYSIIDYKDINNIPLMSERNRKVNIVEIAAFYIYFISKDYKLIRTMWQNGKFLDKIAHRLEEYEKKSLDIMEKYIDTEYYKLLHYQYWQDVKKYE